MGGSFQGFCLESREGKLKLRHDYRSMAAGMAGHAGAGCIGCRGVIIVLGVVRMIMGSTGAGGFNFQVATAGTHLPTADVCRDAYYRQDMSHNATHVRL